MARSLYLDTARLGPMSPTALRLHTEFVRLAAEEPCSLYCEDFLKYGIDTVPEVCERFPQLNLWHGTAELQSRISEALGRGCPEQPPPVPKYDDPVFRSPVISLNNRHKLFESNSLNAV